MAARPRLLPEDEANRRLLEQVHPTGWRNPTPAGRYNLVVVGGGTAGLVAAAGAAILGARVALVEKHLLGGDCLNYGCVPSKALLRAARAAHDVATAAALGVRAEAPPPSVDFPAVMARMRELRARLAPSDSAARLAGLGVDVYLGAARFVAPDAVEVDGRRLRFARAVVTTGSRAARLPVPGLAESGCLTNETVFSLTALPRRLLLVGAGPVGCELGQAFRRFGSEVTIVSLDPRLLPHEDADAAALLGARLAQEGVRAALGARLLRVERRPDGKALIFDRGRGEEQVVGDELLVAVGRTPNVEGLRLEAAGVAVTEAGIDVDDHLRTTNRRVYAAGDVCSAYKLTHAADALARTALQNALFFGRRRASALVIPWCTYTDPEVAHVGLYERGARERGLDALALTLPLSEVDRAVLDDEEQGFGRLLVERRGGRILGATLVARHAGELIAEVVLAMTAGLDVGALARAVHCYPTQAEVWRKLGDAHRRALLTPRVRRLLERLLRRRR